MSLPQLYDQFEIMRITKWIQRCQWCLTMGKKYHTLWKIMYFLPSTLNLCHKFPLFNGQIDYKIEESCCWISSILAPPRPSTGRSTGDIHSCFFISHTTLVCLGKVRWWWFYIWVILLPYQVRSMPDRDEIVWFTSWFSHYYVRL